MKMKMFPWRFYFFVAFSTSTLGLVAQNPAIKWWYNVNDAAFGNGALADLDGDGKPEIVFSTYRNDSMVHVLNAEDGSLLWKYNTLGCNDAAPLILDVDMNGSLEVIVAASCNPKTFCLNGSNGSLKWTVNMHGSDSPPSAADIDSDGKPEILHGEFGGYVICINADSGTVYWQIPVDLNSWIQTEPAIFDADNDGQLDFVVANWSFGTSHRIYCYRANDHYKLWESSLPTDVMYHGAAFADIDQDGKMELTIGSYDGYIYCLNAEDGSKKWDYSFSTPYYVGAPTSIADLDNDGWDDILFIDAWTVGCLNHNGALKWQYSIPAYGQSFRGAALVDMNSDDTLDVVFGTSTGHLYVLNGSRGNVLFDVDLQGHFGTQEFEIDHGPVIADFDGDGKLDVFLVGGHAEYPNIQNNYGRAYAVSFPSSTCAPYASPWPMFRHDIRRSGSIYSQGVGIAETIKYVTPIRVTPNPSRGRFSIGSIEDPENCRLRFFDLLGREVFPDIQIEDSGSVEVEWDGEGYLLIQMEDGRRSLQTKAVILR